MSNDGATTTTIGEVADRARAQLQDLTRRVAEGVTSVERDGEGWRLRIEVLELERVPASTSILGTYDVVTDGEGNLLGYNRVGRYHRNRADEVEQ